MNTTHKHYSEPIAALASGAAGAIGIIRVSGTDCHKLLEPCLHFSKNKPKPRQIRNCEIIDPFNHDELIDEAMAVLFVPPYSYTGEESAEIYCHGGSWVIQKILKTLLAANIREAKPGEFTQRAYLNGKLDLLGAEAVNQLISAQSEQQWIAGRQLATGRLAKEITELRSALISTMAYLEARIDFPDEGETADLGLEEVRLKSREVYQRIEKLLSSYESGRVAAEGLRIALIGAPNAGKSTLLNTLLGKQRAIVTDIEGTTRDYLEESCLILGRLTRLVDTAGIRESDEVVEKLGVESSLKLMREVDLVIFLSAADSTKEKRDGLQELITSNTKIPYLKVLTKADLARPEWSQDWLPISCAEHSGIEELKKQIAAVVDGHVAPLKEQTFVTSLRQVTALEKAKDSLSQFFASDEEGRYDECLAFELQQAARSLTAIIGEVGVDDILDEVFSKFCLGK